MNIDLKKLIWTYLMLHGEPKTNDSYYGLSRNTRETWNELAKVHKAKIDWEKTKPCTDTFSGYFAGTFADHDEQGYKLQGTLILQNGHKSEWVSVVNETYSPIEFINEVLKEKLSDDVESCIKSRLHQLNHQYKGD